MLNQSHRVSVVIEKKASNIKTNTKDTTAESTGYQQLKKTKNKRGNKWRNDKNCRIEPVSTKPLSPYCMHSDTHNQSKEQQIMQVLSANQQKL